MKMGWKNWSSWLKGGVIGVGVGILIILLNLLLSLVKLPYGNPFYWTLDTLQMFLQTLSLYHPVSLILMLFFPYDEHALVYLAFITFPVSLFLIGAFIGWKRDKIKWKSLIVGIVLVIMILFIIRMRTSINIDLIGFIIGIFVLVFIIKSLFEKNKSKFKKK